LVCFATRDDLCFACFATTGEVAAKYDAPDTASKQSTTVIRQQLRGTVWLSRRRSRFGRSILVQRRALAYPQELPRFHPAVDRSRWLSMTWVRAFRGNDRSEYHSQFGRKPGANTFVGATLCLSAKRRPASYGARHWRVLARGTLSRLGRTGWRHAPSVTICHPQGAPDPSPPRPRPVDKPPCMLSNFDLELFVARGYFLTCVLRPSPHVSAGGIFSSWKPRSSIA
jgi:hypothetical protein